ncbi:hypothetical protein KUH03_40580 [Sphingobacterium sp. E70]|uniref:hypothetical protein n=1 Tax=Sphingobacterium sp. E70 TaxID=2853439 RepID=UPI00211C89DF|nr:hypothetical protein [Sphingobacterium sp. E70]ULT25086.1 hypothetical protein KUH03_40580 [Sphingobacterium sp. E70]
MPQGAATTVWCATSPLLEHIGGVYCEDGDIAVLSSDMTDQKAYILIHLMKPMRRNYGN